MSGLLLDFLFLYPLFMSFLWMFGGLYFYWRRERHQIRSDTLPPMDNAPFVSILVPCFDETANAAETIAAAMAQNYPDFEVIAINDGSRDDTGALLDELMTQHPTLRVVQLAANQGKAMALRMGALFARSEYLVCIDGDALLDPNATAFIVQPLIAHPRVGAVTGNPRVRTRSTLLGKIQVGEFSSVIGLIKRAQRVYGNIFTVSGVVVAYRRAALHRCGYWSLDTVTEDIDMSWRLQVDHWGVQYEPNALCWILMPETFKGLWRQRLRWAQGGAEVFLRQIRQMGNWKRRRMWGVVFEYMTSLVWAYALLFSILLWAIGKFVTLPDGLNVPTIQPPEFWGLLLATTCLVQFAVALRIESRYEYRVFRLIGWMIWYPFFFWMLSLATSLVGFPAALLARRGKRATWVSPDRGLQ
ncbi:MAG: poly-beta-1,6-N-acetyl-D-glucosamine synthase [Pseudomonadota bacterium]